MLEGIVNFAEELWYEGEYITQGFVFVSYCVAVASAPVYNWFKRSHEKSLMKQHAKLLSGQMADAYRLPELEFKYHEDLDKDIELFVGDQVEPQTGIFWLVYDRTEMVREVPKDEPSRKT